MKEKVVCKKMLIPKLKTHNNIGRRHKDSSKTIPRVAQKTLPSPILPEPKDPAASNCDDISIIEPTATQASPIWPNDGILRQALMSFTYSDEQIEKHEAAAAAAAPTDPPPPAAVQVIDLTPDANPAKLPSTSHALRLADAMPSFAATDTVCLSSDESLGLDASLPTSEDSFVTLPMSILPMDHLPLPPMSDLKAKRKPSPPPPPPRYLDDIVTTPTLVSTTTEPRKRRQQRSIQQILDAQSTATTYTTSYCNPIMAASNAELLYLSANPRPPSPRPDLLYLPGGEAGPTRANADMLLSGTELLFLPMTTAAATEPRANAQLHALLRGTEAGAAPVGALSLQLLLGQPPPPTMPQATAAASVGIAAMLGSSPPAFYAPRPGIGGGGIGGSVGGGFAAADALAYSGVLPAMSSSQVSSVLSALDSDTHHEAATQSLHLSLDSTAGDKPPPPTPPPTSAPPPAPPPPCDKSKAATAEEALIGHVMKLLASDAEKPAVVAATKQDAQRSLRFREDLQRSVDPPSNGFDGLVEQVSCFKCRFCPFLSLDKAEIAAHIGREHSRELPSAAAAAAAEKRNKLRCPGCSNVFYAPTALKVHLSQDHQVEGEGLDMMVDIVVGNSESAKMTVCKQKKAKKAAAKNLTALPRADSNVAGPDGVVQGNAQNGVGGASLAVDLAKIRVRNLDKEGAEPEPGRRRDDDAEAERKAERVADEEAAAAKPPNPTEYKEVKSDLTELLVCSPAAPAPDSPPGAGLGEEPGTEAATCRRRGRPRGSRNQPLSAVTQPEDTVHAKDIGYKCEVDGCAVRLQSHDKIEYHRRCHAGAAFACPECAALTAHWSALLAHLWRVHSIDMGLYACDACSYKTTSYCKLVNIHKRIHSEDRPFLCDTCGKGFKNPKQMRNHKVIHNSTRVRSDPGGASLGSCDVCGRSFNSARLLRLHLDNVHRKLRPHLCNFCGYSASSRSTLKMHMRQHTGEKPFQCDECEYRTADHNSLRRHKMRHSGDKPYKCPHCVYACIQSSTYKAHLKSKHPGLDKGLMFSCQLCSFRSVKKDNLVAHMAEHEVGAVFSPPQRRTKPPPGAAPVDAPPPTQPPDLGSVADIHLIYVNGDSVTDASHSLSQLMPAGTDDGTDTQIPDFEPEEITGDIRELGQMAEPGELKFKVLQEHQ